MYVRIPVDLEYAHLCFRQFYTGRIAEIDEIADRVIVDMIDLVLGEVINAKRDCPINYITRIRILPDTKFKHLESRKTGKILCLCEDNEAEIDFLKYYAYINGEVKRVYENEIIITSNRGDPNPIDQLLNYEFQHPTFKTRRDNLVKSYSDLHDATDGIVDLLGARVILLAHQAEVVSQVLSDPECRYILADEVGLGKTIEACVILKGLRRRIPKLRTLIIAPASLTHQWYFELDQKFWLRFARSDNLNEYMGRSKYPGLIVSAEDLVSKPENTLRLKVIPWDLIIVDEGHQIRKNEDLYDHIIDLSENASRALILTATPIQRRAEEFLALLRLMNPTRYNALTNNQFNMVLASQFPIMQKIAGVVPDLKPEFFDAEDFLYVMNEIAELLNHDDYLVRRIDVFENNNGDITEKLSDAKKLVSYICTNYRLEQHVIRNRRINLQIELPERKVVTNHAYNQEECEIEMIGELHDYLDEIIHSNNREPWSLEFARIFLHATYSSPYALEDLLNTRLEHISENEIQNVVIEDLKQLINPSEPRFEENRQRELIKSLPITQGEENTLRNLLWKNDEWVNATEEVLEGFSMNRLNNDFNHRIINVLFSIGTFLRNNPAGKIVVFSSWVTTLTKIKKQLVRHRGTSSFAEFHTGISTNVLQIEADRFQNEEGCSIMLCDELGGEGRNFQIADLIIHVDMPWTPSLIEQRIGRVDRLGRAGIVTSDVIFARESLENDLFNLWQGAFGLFSQSMSGMEIALEDIQDEIVRSLGESTRSGLMGMKERMTEKARDLREQVEKERYFEEETINERRREEFNRLQKSYSDGSILRKPVVAWAKQAGLTSSYIPELDVVVYHPRQFSRAAMENAKFAHVPNMEIAAARARNPNVLELKGTFNRQKALLSEDLIFYAPGSDPWTDAILTNAMEADRGRCCAIRRISPHIDSDITVFEFFYRIILNPVHLYRERFDPVYLLRGQGYIQNPTLRIIISESGEIFPTSHPIYEITIKNFNGNIDTHLGKRGGDNHQMVIFFDKFPQDLWREILSDIYKIVKEKINSEIEKINFQADEAVEEFSNSSMGMKASMEWLHNVGVIENLEEELCKIEQFETISAALIKGIRNPIFRLESVCYWEIISSNNGLL